MSSMVITRPLLSFFAVPSVSCSSRLHFNSIAFFIRGSLRSWIVTERCLMALALAPFITFAIASRFLTIRRLDG